MTPNEFMTDKVSLEKMPIFSVNQKSGSNKKLPGLVGGFGSHDNVQEAHEIFEMHKMLFIKQEGGASQVNQAYDQKVANDDKIHMHAAVDALSLVIGLKMEL